MPAIYSKDTTNVIFVGSPLDAVHGLWIHTDFILFFVLQTKWFIEPHYQQKNLSALLFHLILYILL